ncbi:pinensin family lanthipeptide [Longimicrobium terrae]|uniref:Uncharacterized protein n=1 Tax=Longimicrobium terrae TaxID=1639882 RepID=A0A841GZA0_9BACT|nr:pinensin family lanthipeptide [Longimicrobium terrae]MBB4636880.1 hypothetical protein [Longimicrobium terrae]MBB6071121.1 hypothetical protein [Longimicrobium terrae]NNC29170.1 hypothetical protein [Longimicrobium terrae]
MKKLSLKLDELRIDSFVTDAESAERGTVQGAQISAAGTCIGQNTCRCTRAECYQPSEPGYATFVNNICIRC